jgi:hypothetical protein
MNPINKFYVKVDDNFKEFYAINGAYAKEIAKEKYPESVIGDAVSSEKYDLYCYHKKRIKINKMK